MNEEKLIEIIKIQNEILNIFMKQYIMIDRHTPFEKEQMNELRKKLENLNKEIE